MVQAVITENAPGKAPATDIDPFAPEDLRDTYAYHDMLRALGKILSPFLPWWQKITQRESMIPGGFGELIFQAEDAGELDPGTASGLIMSMLRGGMDTTISAIGSALWLLTRNQEQWELLRREPNRDPSRWENPTKFDITRQTTGQLALGYGIHNCIGQMIARLEFESVVGPFAKLVKAVALDASEAPPSYRPNNALRTLAALPRVCRCAVSAAAARRDAAGVADAGIRRCGAAPEQPPVVPDPDACGAPRADRDLSGPPGLATSTNEAPHHVVRIAALPHSNRVHGLDARAHAVHAVSAF